MVVTASLSTRSLLLLLLSAFAIGVAGILARDAAVDRAFGSATPKIMLGERDSGADAVTDHKTWAERVGSDLNG